MGAEARIVINAQAAPKAATYAARHAGDLSAAGFQAAFDEIRRWPGYRPTPLLSLPGHAAALGLAGLHYKDEAHRFGLKSFKAIGGAYAVSRLLVRQIEASGAGRGVTTADLIAGHYRAQTQAITITSATDGNHGRAVAWGARLFGCRAVIFIHAGVSEARRAAIAAFGAEVVRVPGGYDDSVRHTFAEAARNGWHVVQDTATDTYREVPADITWGYGVIAREIVDQIADIPTHVFVQAGVGGVASAVCAVFWQAWGAARPAFVVIEPATADCIYRSIAAGRPTAVPGDADTFMAGLACGEVSLLAWDILKDGADAVLAIDDAFARRGMQALARPPAGDPAIVGGECSGGALGALMALRENPDLANRLGIGPTARVLLVGTEGDTDAAIYREVVGVPAADIAPPPASA